MALLMPQYRRLTRYPSRRSSGTLMVAVVPGPVPGTVSVAALLGYAPSAVANHHSEQRPVVGTCRCRGRVA